MNSRSIRSGSNELPAGPDAGHPQRPPQSLDLPRDDGWANERYQSRVSRLLDEIAPHAPLGTLGQPTYSATFGMLTSPFQVSTISRRNPCYRRVSYALTCRG